MGTLRAGEAKNQIRNEQFLMKMGTAPSWMGEGTDGSSGRVKRARIASAIGAEAMASRSVPVEGH
jgi:hypothetical protein